MNPLRQDLGETKMVIHFPNGVSHVQERQRRCVLLSDSAACMLKTAGTLKAFYLRLVCVVVCSAYQPSIFLDLFQKGII
jgi:hypothetical protein